MSSFYLDILKDRLYTSGTDSKLRRSAQTVLFEILAGLLKLMHPILCFTSAESWDSLYGVKQNESLRNSIYFMEFPAQPEVLADQQMMVKWEQLIKIRADITKALEIARTEKVIGHPLEAEVSIQISSEFKGFVHQEWDTIKEICIISELTELPENSENIGIRYESEEIEGFIIQVQPARGGKCERCWIRSTTVGQNPGHPEICERCCHVVEDMKL